ncbi:hypothetical protein [Clostridium aciditolerans]|uniref:Uncharacterized protein n=1 Tax=Clostridium aciditolerans TaxID=339861 RepID=A0A934I1S5_9CLOT|nr:hypothetical protein [Clostridium aciditolerans]MBI6874733.1 hypothetical protein [Clostridium aciditolerans]
MFPSFSPLKTFSQSKACVLDDLRTFEKLAMFRQLEGAKVVLKSFTKTDTKFLNLPSALET